MCQVIKFLQNVIAVHSHHNGHCKCVGPVMFGCQCRLATPGRLYRGTVLVAVLGFSYAVKAEMYADEYGDLMTWLYGGSPVHGKANRFSEVRNCSKPGLEPSQNQQLLQLMLVKKGIIVFYPQGAVVWKFKTQYIVALKLH